MLEFTQRLLMLLLHLFGLARSLNIWDELELAVAFKADNREIPPVGGKYGADVFPLGVMGQRTD